MLLMREVPSYDHSWPCASIHPETTPGVVIGYVQFEASILCLKKDIHPYLILSLEALRYTTDLFSEVELVGGLFRYRALSYWRILVIGRFDLSVSVGGTRHAHTGMLL